MRATWTRIRTCRVNRVFFSHSRGYNRQLHQLRNNGICEEGGAAAAAPGWPRRRRRQRRCPPPPSPWGASARRGAPSGSREPQRARNAPASVRPALRPTSSAKLTTERRRRRRAGVARGRRRSRRGAAFASAFGFEGGRGRRRGQPCNNN